MATNMTPMKMKSLALAWGILLSLAATANAVSDTVAEVEKAREVEFHDEARTIGLVHEDAKITFIADAAVRILVATPDQDENNRTFVDGQKATAFHIIAKDCRFTIYRPRVSRAANKDTMAKQWTQTVLAVKALEKGEPVVITFYQPEIDIRRSVAKRISGIGGVHFKRN